MRITQKDLEAVCRLINLETDSPLESYAVNGEGKMKANIGNHHIGYAYGGVCLQRIVSEGGGVSCPLDNCHIPKKELYGKMHAYLAGLEHKA